MEQKLINWVKMSEEQRKQLQQQLWNIANTLRGKMGADEFRDYILGFIFYKYLSEKVQRFADEQLKQDGLKYGDLKEGRDDNYISALEDACITALNNAENLEQCFSLGGKSWTVGKGSGGCDVGLVVKTETVTVTDNSNGGCGKSSTFGGNEPALTLAQQIACQKAFGNALTFQQCFSLGGIWATLAKVVIDGAGHERTGVCGFKKCSPNEQTGLCK